VSVQPEEVLELIGSALERYDTVRAALRYRGDGPTKKGIRELIVRRAFQVSPREAYRPIRHLQPDGPLGGAAEHGTQTTTTGAWRRKFRAAG
jgi:hypothetical protein